MKRTFVAVLMAMAFGLFSMPALQAAPSNGWTIGSIFKSATPVEKAQYRRRRRRRRHCYVVHQRRSRMRQRCRWW